MSNSSAGLSSRYVEGAESDPMDVIVLLRTPSKENNHSNPRNTSKSSTGSAIVCRICHDGDRPEKMISPCHCIGSLALVHVSCIEKWLTTSNKDYCEICKLKLKTSIQYPPASQWLLLKRRAGGPNGIYGDVFRFVILTPLCFICAFFCMSGAMDYRKQGLWQGCGLTVLCTFLLLGYVLWVYVTVRFHIRCYRRWSSFNQTIHLVETSYHMGRPQLDVSTANDLSSDPFSS